MKKEVFKFAVLLMVAIGAGPVTAAVWQWSTSPGANASADPGINWAESMAPSAVNDSARAMMAALAVQNRDQGQLQSGGTASAITLTTNTGYPSIAALNGQLITFQHFLSAGNNDGATITIDGQGPFPLYVGTSPIAAGTLTDRGVFTIACFSSTSRCYLVNRYQDTFNIPLGAILWSTAPSPPNANFVAPSGQCISTTTYAAYWVQQGSPASGGCPGGQFAIIDMRGRVPAGLDTLNASAANRLTNSANGCGVAFTAVGAVCTENQSATLQTTNLPPYTPSGSINSVSTSTIQDLRLSAGGSAVTTSVAPGTNLGGSFGSAAGNVTTSTVSTFSGSAQGGASTPFSKVQPTIGLMPYLRIL